MSLKLSLVTPDGEWSHDEVESVVLPGSEGDFGVLPSHERFLTALRVGEVEIRTREEHLFGAISDGFAAVDGDEVVVMVESGEFAHDIDVAQAELAVERAEQGLAALGRDAEAERFAEYEIALARARNRVAVAKRASG